MAQKVVKVLSAVLYKSTYSEARGAVIPAFVTDVRKAGKGNVTLFVMHSNEEKFFFSPAFYDAKGEAPGSWHWPPDVEDVGVSKAPSARVTRLKDSP